MFHDDKGGGWVGWILVKHVSPTLICICEVWNGGASRSRTTDLGFTAPHTYTCVYECICKTRLIHEKTTIQIQKKDRNTTTKAITTTQIQVQVHKRRAACLTCFFPGASSSCCFCRICTSSFHCRRPFWSPGLTCGLRLKYHLLLKMVRAEDWLIDWLVDSCWKNSSEHPRPLPLSLSGWTDPGWANRLQSKIFWQSWVVARCRTGLSF